MHVHNTHAHQRSGVKYLGNLGFEISLLTAPYTYVRVYFVCRDGINSIEKLETVTQDDMKQYTPVPADFLWVKCLLFQE